MSEWQDIKTAPKDGTRILIWLPWDDDDEPEVVIAKWAHDDGGGGWDCGDAMLFPETPTHWMSLPDPPSRRGDGDHKPTGPGQPGDAKTNAAPITNAAIEDV